MYTHTGFLTGTRGLSFHSHSLQERSRGFVKLRGPVRDLGGRGRGKDVGGGEGGGWSREDSRGCFS